MVSEPRNGRELGPVGDLVKCQPESKLTRREAVPGLQPHHVRTHVVDDVLLFGQLVGDEKVVLAQHSGRHPGQDQTQLGTAHRPAGTDQGTGHPDRERGHGAGRSACLQLAQRGTKEPLHGCEVRPHPGLPVDDGGSGRRGWPQAGGLAHQALRPSGQLGKVLFHGGRSIARGQGSSTDAPGGNPLGDGPVDEAGPGGWRGERRQIGGHRIRPLAQAPGG